MEFSSLLVREVIDRISKLRLLTVYQETLKSDLESIILPLYEQHYENKDVQESLRALKKDFLRRTKRRWLDNAVRDFQRKDPKKNRELIGEYKALLPYYETNGEELFRNQFKEDVSSPEELINSRIKVLEAWCEDDSKLITDYAYITQKTKKQREKAISTDISIIIGLTLLDPSFQNNQHQNIIESPFSTVENPFFSNSRAKLIVEQPLLKKEGKEYFSSLYNSEDGTDYELLIEKEYAEETGNKVSDLDRFDYKVFLEIMSKRDELFATQKVIHIKIGDLVKSLYDTDSQRNYKSIEERITKMKHYSMTKIQEDKKLAYGIFDFVDITTMPNGTRIAEIHVNEVIYRDYIQRQTVRIYKNKVEKLSLDAAYHLLFIMQKERLICYETNSSYTVARDYLYFSTKVRFRKRRKNENLIEIEKALDELVEQKLAVQSYKRNGQVFQISFIPVGESEVQDLLSGDYEYAPLSFYQTVQGSLV
ncbi:hypothetical protein [Priestia koreensis]|uniref:Uncharacterized protein n=1 Tax=Priestia koreensis TaxID=284581 RepID=A0A0M0LBC4_9BACI|nr:hypothetical protein [Priestia koreensis]KOO48157.1 hypothetical protein AMD01_04950 [Priestia koreensis]